MSRIVTKPTKWHVRPAKIQISLGIRLGVRKFIEATKVTDVCNFAELMCKLMLLELVT